MRQMKAHGDHAFKKTQELKLTARKESLGHLASNKSLSLSLSLNKKRTAIKMMSTLYGLRVMPEFTKLLALTILGDGLGQEISTRFCFEYMQLTQRQNVSMLILSGDIEADVMGVCYVGDLHTDNKRIDDLMLARGGSDDRTLRLTGPTLGEFKAEHKNLGIIYDTNGLGQIRDDLKILGIKTFANTPGLAQGLSLILYNALQLANAVNMLVNNAQEKVSTTKPSTVNIYFRPTPEIKEEIKSLNSAIGRFPDHRGNRTVYRDALSLSAQHVEVNRHWFFNQLEEKARNSILSTLGLPEDALSEIPKFKNTLS